MQNPPETKLIVSTLESTPRWRNNLLSILQILGVLLAVIGSGELLGLFSLFDPEWSKKLAIAGPAITFAAKPVLSLIGDFLDDGKRNNSFRLETEVKDDPRQGQLPFPIILFTFLSLSLLPFMTSCGVKVNADGSKDVSVDPKTALALAKILAEK